MKVHITSLGQAVRAGVLHEPLDLRVEERPDPAPAPGGVVIEVAYNGLCGTDASEYTKGPMMVPLHIRHPGSGHLGPPCSGTNSLGPSSTRGQGAAPDGAPGGLRCGGLVR